MKQYKAWGVGVSTVLRALRSNTFFWVLLGVFVLEALWIALSGAYSMAFDEYFHLGKIQLYAHQWLPFFSGTPAGSTQFGAVARDPSYLYHYLLSFPYRLFAHFFHAQIAQVIFLRALDIAMFAGGLVVFRTAFQRAGISRVVLHTALFFFILLPVVPFLAGQINYDNLLFLVAGLSLLLVVMVVNRLRATGRVPARLALELGSVLLLGSLVKYAYLPFVLGVVVYLLWTVRKVAKEHKRSTASVLFGDAKALKTIRGVAVCILFVLSMGLFVERYGVNTISYHTPTPECDAVIGLDACRDYDPFARNQGYKEQNLKAVVTLDDKVEYPITWARNMMRSLFFTVGPRELNYPPGEPLRLAYIAGWIAAVGGVVLLVVRCRWLLRSNPVFSLFFITSGLYVAVLFLQNLSDFMQLGVAVAVQGRYILIVLPLLFVLVATAVRDSALKCTYGKQLALSVLTVLALLVVLQGGGVAPFIIRSADAWMWPNSFMQHANHTVRNMLWPIIVK